MHLGKSPPTQKAKRAPKDREYLGKVKTLSCAVCGAPPPSDAHHCTHRPSFDGPNPYQQEPAAGRKSGDRDAIPLCKAHHQNGPDAIHFNKLTWREKHGPDFGYIEQTRELVNAMEDDEILGDWL